MKRWIRASYLTGMHELLGAYGGDVLVNNVFGLSSLTPECVEDPYKPIDYFAAVAVFDSILLNVDSLRDLVRLNHDVQAVRPWGLVQEYAAQARSRTALEYWARLQSMTRLMLPGWRSSLRDDDEEVTILSDWTHHPGIGLATVGACFSVHQIGSMFGVMPLRLRMPFHPGEFVRKRIEEELPGVEIDFEAPYQQITYRRSQLLTAPPIPAVSGPTLTYHDLLNAYYPRGTRAAAVSVLDAAMAMIDDGMEPTLRSVAKRTGIAPRALQRGIASGGLTVRAAVERVRVVKAEQLLAETDQSILDIAVAVGYAGHQALARVFKRWRGLSPTEYRHYLECNQPG